MNKQEFLRLLDKYLAGAATEEEIRLLLRYYNSFPQAAEWNEAELGNSKELEDRLLQQLAHSLQQQQQEAGGRR